MIFTGSLICILRNDYPRLLGLIRKKDKSFIGNKKKIKKKLSTVFVF